MTKILKRIFLFICLVCIAVNSFQLFSSLFPDHPIGFSGIKFAGLHDVLKEESRIGYLTDKNLNDDANLAEYEQAQLMVAPAILLLNDASARFLIVNCSNDGAALQKLIEIKAQPLKRNPFGVILAQNTRFQP